MNQKQYNKKVKRGPTSSPLLSRMQSSHSPPPLTSTTTIRYLCDLSLAPGVIELLERSTLITKVDDEGIPEPTVRSASDFSYSAEHYAGKNYRIVGDAGCEPPYAFTSAPILWSLFFLQAFIDPFFSSGVHLALTSALSAASTICASIRGDCSEEEAAEWHTKRVATSYTRSGSLSVSLPLFCLTFLHFQISGCRSECL